MIFDRSHYRFASALRQGIYEDGDFEAAWDGKNARAFDAIENKAGS